MVLVTLGIYVVSASFTYCNLSRTKPLIPKWLSDFIVCWLLKVVLQIYKKKQQWFINSRLFYAHVLQYFPDFSWQRASSCWTYLQTTLHLDENTLRINSFCISLINRVLCSFVDSWLSCFTRFVDKSIALSGQYACFSRPTACRLSAKVKPLIRLRHDFDGK